MDDIRRLIVYETYVTYNVLSTITNRTHHNGNEIDMISPYDHSDYRTVLTSYTILEE